MAQSLVSGDVCVHILFSFLLGSLIYFGSMSLKLAVLLIFINKISLISFHACHPVDQYYVSSLIDVISETIDINVYLRKLLK